MVFGDAAGGEIIGGNPRPLMHNSTGGLGQVQQMRVVAPPHGEVEGDMLRSFDTAVPSKLENDIVGCGDQIVRPALAEAVFEYPFAARGQ